MVLVVNARRGVLAGCVIVIAFGLATAEDFSFDNNAYGDSSDLKLRGYCDLFNDACPKWSDGVQGASIHFDGINDAVILGSPALYGARDGSFSLGFWVKLDDDSRKDYGTINTVIGGPMTVVIAQRRLSISLGQGQLIAEEYVIPTGSWVHFTIIYQTPAQDLLKGELRIYAQFDELIAQGESEPMDNLAIPFTLGAQVKNDIASDVLSGELDEFRFVNHGTPIEDIPEVIRILYSHPLIVDTQLPTNGPGNMDCVSPDWRHDEVEFDGEFTCICPSYRDGSRCEKLIGEPIHKYELSASSSFEDSGTQRIDGTCSAGTCPTFSDTQPGAWFSGGQYLSVGKDDDFGIVGTSFSMTAWVKTDYQVATDLPILGGERLHLILRGRRAYLGFYGNDFVSDIPFYPNQWNHIAFTYNHQSGTMSIFFNGEEEVDTERHEPLRSTNDDFYIGAHTFRDPWDTFIGGIQDLRIYPYPLYEDDVNAIFAESPIPPSEKCKNFGFENSNGECICTDTGFTGDTCETPPEPTAWYTFESSFDDTLGNFQSRETHDYSLPTRTTLDNVGNLKYAAEFNSSTAFTLANSTELGLVERSFTILAWVKPTNGARYTKGDLAIISTPYLRREKYSNLHLVLRNGKVYVGFWAKDFRSTALAPLNEWSHVGFSYNAATGVQGVFLNGVGSFGTDGRVPFTANYEVAAGIWRSINDGFVGQMADLRIYPAALNDVNVQDIYNRGGIGTYFSPEHGPNGMGCWYEGAPVPSTATSYTCDCVYSTGDNCETPDFTWESGNSDHWKQYCTDDCPTADDSYGFGSSTMVFERDNGQGQALTLLTADDMKLTDHSFTVSAWVWPDYRGETDDFSVFGTGDFGTQHESMHLVLRNQKAYMGFFGNDFANPNAIVRDRTWTHIVWRYSAQRTQMTVSVNGNVFSDTASRQSFKGTGQVYIGRWSNDRFFRGAIANLEVKSVAVSDEELQLLYTNSIPDTFVVANGPNGFGCGEGSFVDTVPFDGKYTCECGDRQGDNCEDVGPTGTFLFDNNFNNLASPGQAGSCDGDNDACPTFGNYISDNARALEFDGQNDELELGKTVEELGIRDSDFSVSAWIKVQYQGSKDESILGSKDARGLHLVIRNRVLHMGFYGNDLASNLQVEENEWTHVAFVYSKTLRTQFVFKNGQSQFRGNADSFKGVGDVILGNWGDNRGDYFNGYIANINIFPTALSRGEIFEEYSTTLPNEKFPSLGPNGLPCLNEGILSTDANGELTCDCTGGFSGDNCELEPNQPDPCENVVCDNPPGQCYQSSGFCLRGNCTYSWKPEGESCNDGSEYTIEDFCTLGKCDGVYEFPDLVASWSFDEIEDNVVDDSGRFELDATLSGLERGNLVQGRIGLGFEANVVGTNQGITIPELPERLEGHFTLSCWVKPADGSMHQIDVQATRGVDGTKGQKYLINPRIGTGDIAGVGISVASNGVSVYEHKASYMPSLLTFQGGISTELWTHVAVVYDNYQPSLYINGEFKKKGLKSPALSSFLGGTTIGKAGYGNYEGSFDECRIHSKALSLNELSEMVKADSIEDPVYHWKFDEGRGLVAQDTSVSRNDGAMTSSMEDNWVKGRNHDALKFETVTDYITLSKPPIFSVAKDFTFCLWANPGKTIGVKTEKTTGVDGLRSPKQAYAVYPVQGTNAFGGTNAGAGVSVGTNGIAVIEHAAYYLPVILFYEAELSGWNHVCVVYNDNRPSLYLNGVFAKQGLQSPKKDVHFAGAIIGGGRWGRYQGILDDIVVYARSLSSANIAAAYVKTLNEDPVLEYHFDGNLEDGSLSGNPLTGTNAAYNQGIVNEAIRFTNGASVQTQNAMTPILYNEFTIMFWARPTTTHQIDTQRASGTSGLAGQAWLLYPNQVASLIDVEHAGIGISLGTNGISVYEHTSSHFPAVLSWTGDVQKYTQFAITFNDGRSHLYVNGRYIKDGVQSIKTPVLAGKLTFGSGRSSDYSGDLDEFRVYNRVVSSSEISKMFENDLFRIVCPDKFELANSVSDCEDNFGGAICEGTCSPGYIGVILSYVCDPPTRTWMSLNETLSCQPCPAGTRDVNRDGNCVACGQGTYSPDFASVGMCPMCPVGKVDADADPVTECHDCDAGSYQDEPGKRTCKDVTLCPAGFGYFGDATPSSNTDCRPCVPGLVKVAEGNTRCVAPKTCADHEYEVVAPTTTTDRVCEPCPDGTVKGETGCEDVRECRPGTYETADSTATSHPECKFCGVGEVDHDSDPQTPCQTCPEGVGAFIPQGQAGPCEKFVCSKGYVDHDDDKSTACEACNGNTLYQNEEGQKQCKQVVECEAGKITLHAPTMTSDRICEFCEPGFFISEGTDNCVKIRTCVPGQYIEAPQTASSDRICGNCDGENTFSSQPNQGECSNTYTCRAGEQETTAPTAASDRSCTPCDPLTYKRTAGSQQCVQCTATCGPGQYLVPCEDGVSGRTLDAQCLPCGAQTFKEGTNDATECKPQIQRCDEGHFLSFAGDVRNSAVCQVCTSCAPSRYQTGGCDGIDDTECSACLSQSDCESNEFIDGQCQGNQNNKCLQCPTKCTSCTSADMCTGCKGNLVLQGGQCQGTCDPKHYASASETCEPCDDTCGDECEGPGPSDCITCPDGHFLHEGQCIKSCQEQGNFYNDEERNECVKCTSKCPEGQFAKVACSANADTTCTPFTQCDRDSFILSPGTPTSDRACKKCSTCTAGQATTVCTASKDTVCTNCAELTYQDVAEQTQCKPVSICQPGTYEQTAATPSTDKVCTSCPSGKYQPGRDKTSCIDATVCPAGTHVANAATKVADTVCVDCIPQVTYQDNEGMSACKTVRNCDGLLLVQEATRSSDRVCTLHFSCPFETYEIAAPTLTTERECEAKQKCDSATQFEFSPGSNTEDRTCLSLTVCVNGWTQRDAPTATSDRTCEKKTEIAFAADFAETLPNNAAKAAFKQNLENSLDALSVKYDKDRVTLREGSIVATIYTLDEDSASKLDKAISDGLLVVNMNGEKLSAVTPEAARSKSSGGSSKVPIIAGACAGLVVLVALIAIFIVARKRKSAAASSAADPTLYQPSHVSFNNPLYEDEKETRNAAGTGEEEEDGGIYQEPSFREAAEESTDGYLDVGGYQEPKVNATPLYDTADDGYMDVKGAPVYDTATDGYLDVHPPNDGDDAGYMDVTPETNDGDDAGYMDVTPETN